MPKGGLEPSDIPFSLQKHFSSSSISGAWQSLRACTRAAALPDGSPVATSRPAAGSLDRARLHPRSTTPPSDLLVLARQLDEPFFPASADHTPLQCLICVLRVSSPCSIRCASAESCSHAHAAPGEWFRLRGGEDPSCAARIVASTAINSLSVPLCDPEFAAPRPGCAPAACSYMWLCGRDPGKRQSRQPVFIEALPQLAHAISALQPCFVGVLQKGLSCRDCQERFGLPNPIEPLARRYHQPLHFSLFLAHSRRSMDLSGVVSFSFSFPSLPQPTISEPLQLCNCELTHSYIPRRAFALPSSFSGFLPALFLRAFTLPTFFFLSRSRSILLR
jgi:hypothetical protein